MRVLKVLQALPRESHKIGGPQPKQSFLVLLNPSNPRSLNFRTFLCFEVICGAGFRETVGDHSCSEIKGLLMLGIFLQRFVLWRRWRGSILLEFVEVWVGVKIRVPFWGPE